MPEMKRNIIIILILVLSTVNFPETFNVTAQNSEMHSYTITLSFEPANATVTGTLNMRYVNHASKSLNNLCFHIYPNAFKSKGGYIDILQVKNTEGDSLRFTVEGEDETILRTILTKPLKPGDAVNVTIDFRIKIPNVADRFGYKSGIYCLGNALPIASVYEDEVGWNNDPYYPYGESFNSEFASYLVTVKCPLNYIVAATGVLINKMITDGLKTTIWRANPVREFVIVFGNNFEVSKQTVGNVTVYSYYLPEHSEYGIKALEWGVKALTHFSEHFGMYPYPEYRIVETYGWFGGMEYPNLVMISSSLYTAESADFLELVVAHETAHQWWYCMAGNDENDEPWLDEAFAEYSEILYYEWEYGPEVADEMFERYILSSYHRYLNSGKKEYPLSESVWSFGDDTNAYYTMIYDKGACVLRLLRFVMGDEKFFEALRLHFERSKFKLIRIQDFIDTCQKVYGSSLQWFFNEWLFDAGNTAFKIEDAYALTEKGKYVLHFSIYQSNSRYINLVPILIKTESGEKLSTVWVNDSRIEFNITLATRPTEIIVDPYDYVPGIDRKNSRQVEVVAGSHRSERHIIVSIALTLVAIILVIIAFKLVKKREPAQS